MIGRLGLIMLDSTVRREEGVLFLFFKALSRFLMEGFEGRLGGGELWGSAQAGPQRGASVRVRSVITGL